MKKPLVSFVFPSFNRRLTVLKVLGLLKAEAAACGGEVIVVDNASSDGSADAIAERFPEVRIIRSRVNLGAAARNLGIEAARGEFIFMLDDDSSPLPRSTLPGIAMLRADARAGCVAYQVELPGGGRWTNGVYTVFTGCGALFPKKVLKQIGGYPQDILYYAEEYDVAFRLWSSGYKVLNPRELAVLHHKKPGNPDFKRRLGLLVSNNALIYSRYLPLRWAAERIEYENWRYRAIAHKEGVMAGYAEGLRLAAGLAARGFSSDAARLKRGEAGRALGLDGTARRLRAFGRAGAKRALMLTAGKLVPETLGLAAAAGIKTVAVADENPHMAGADIAGVPVIHWKDMDKHAFDCYISGSASLMVNDRLEVWAAEKRKPFMRACGYDPVPGWRKL